MPGTGPLMISVFITILKFFVFNDQLSYCVCVQVNSSQKFLRCKLDFCYFLYSKKQDLEYLLCIQSQKILNKIINVFLIFFLAKSKMTTQDLGPRDTGPQDPEPLDRELSIPGPQDPGS